MLSGYCIHRNGLRSDHSEMLPFTIRRCFRILPIYFVASAFGIALIYIYGNSLYGSPADVHADCLAAEFFFYTVLTPAYYGCADVGNGPLGTVAVEVVLYALYALFFWLFVWRKAERWIWFLCALSFIGLLTSALMATSYPNQYVWWQNGSVFGFLPYWWLGAAFINPAVAGTIRRFLWPLLVAWACLTAVVVLLEPSAFVGEIRKLVFGCCIGLLVCWLETAAIARNNPAATIGRAG